MKETQLPSSWDSSQWYPGNVDTEDQVKILEKLQSDKPGNSGSTWFGSWTALCASLQGCLKWSVCLCDLILTGIRSTYSHCKKSNLEELLFWVYISAIKHDLLRTNGGIWTYKFSFDLFLALTSNIGYATIVPRIFGHLTQYFWFRGKSSLVIVYAPIY